MYCYGYYGCCDGFWVSCLFGAFVAGRDCVCIGGLWRAIFVIFYLLVVVGFSSLGDLDMLACWGDLGIVLVLDWMVVTVVVKCVCGFNWHAVPCRLRGCAFGWLCLVLVACVGFVYSLVV